jgi:hypothetical protein
MKENLLLCLIPVACITAYYATLMVGATAYYSIWMWNHKRQHKKNIIAAKAEYAHRHRECEHDRAICLVAAQRLAKTND